MEGRMFKIKRLFFPARLCAAGLVVIFFFSNFARGNKCAIEGALMKQH